MEILVIHYTDWIGYHVVDTLLNEGYQVSGIEKEAGNPHLKDFFSRNSNFMQPEEKTEKKYSHVICIGEHEDAQQYQAESYLFINTASPSEISHTLTIQIPFLFGEFMPMDEFGFYEGKKRIEFASEVFREKGIYIADFLNVFIEWLQNPPEKAEIIVKSRKHRENQDVILEKYFLIHENIPIGTKLKDVIDHYNKHNTLYPQITK